MKKLIPIIIAILLIFSACSNNVEQSNNQQLSPAQSQYLFRNVSLGMTMDEVKYAEKENGCTFIDNTNSSMTRENVETIVESAKKDNTSVFIDNGDSCAIANAEFSGYRGTIGYDFADNKLLVITFLFDEQSEKIYDKLKTLKFQNIEADEIKDKDQKDTNGVIYDKVDISTWDIQNNESVELKLYHADNKVTLIFHGLNAT